MAGRAKLEHSQRMGAEHGFLFSNCCSEALLCSFTNHNAKELQDNLLEISETSRLTTFTKGLGAQGNTSIAIIW